MAARPDPMVSHLTASLGAPEWKVKIALDRCKGDANAAGDLLMAREHEPDDWWRERATQLAAAAAPPLLPAMIATGFPEWKCRAALAAYPDPSHAINFLYENLEQSDGWWNSLGVPEGEPPVAGIMDRMAAGIGALLGGGDGGGAAPAVAPPVEYPEAVRALCARSRSFGAGLAYDRHPLVNQRVERLVRHPPPGVAAATFMSETAAHIEGVRPVADTRVLSLLESFLQIKRASGSAIEQDVYAEMSVDGLLDRMLTKRPLAFVEGNDSYLLRSGDRGLGGFDEIGGERDTGAGPMTLHELQSYDEMCLSALIGVSVPTHFINEGGRRNHGEYGVVATFQSKGVLIGLAGARFEREGKMEWQHMLVTRDQNTAANGYGQVRGATPAGEETLLQMWAKFYKLTHLPTYDEVVRKHGQGDTSYCQLGSSGRFLNVSVYKERMRAVLAPFLLDANARAKEAGAQAYCHLVGLGLGVWMVTEQQGLYLVEVVSELLAQFGDDLSDIGTLDFSWFPQVCAQIGCGGAQHDGFAQAGDHRVKVRFSRRDPCAKLQMADRVDQSKDLLLVAMYAWDSNSYPGNEYWSAPTQGQGCLSASGDPAAACCSTIAELQNPAINPERVCAGNMQWLGPEDGGAPAVPQAEAPALQQALTQEQAEAWQHGVIDAARDGEWPLLLDLILPRDGRQLMPDELLNGFPGPRSFNVLHQLAMARPPGHDHRPCETLRHLLSAGCRFDASVRSRLAAGPIFAPQGDRSGADLTAREIAKIGGCAKFLVALDAVPPYEVPDPGAELTKTQSLTSSAGSSGGGGGGGGGLEKTHTTV